MSQRKVALVTGASRGIGEATAVALARDGFDVAVAARTAEALEGVAARCREHGGRTAIIPTDVTEQEQVRAMVDAAAGELGGLDVLVNNAGGSSFQARLVDLRPDGWDKILRLNLTQVYWATQAAGRRMVAQGSGSIVNVASVAGVGAAIGMAPYGAAKAAVISLTRTAAMEWGPHGVRVNAVAPGWVRTELTEFAHTDAQITQRLVGKAALARWGEPDEIAEVIAFVAGSRATYLTGQTIVVDGGLTIAGADRPSREDV